MLTDGAGQPSWQDSIPIELRERPQWVGRTSNKEPINARTSKLASSTDLKTWATFAEAVAAAESTSLAGAGYVFGPCPYFGVDLDHAFDKAGALKAWADQIVRAFEGSAYIERSPSGTGLHIIGQGKAPRQGKVKTEDGAVEVYDRDRYFTVTGQPYGAPVATIGNCQDELAKLCARLWPNEQPAGSGAQWSTELTDLEVIGKALGSKNGPKFHALYYAGDLSEYADNKGKVDQSKADMALVGYLAYWCGPNPQQIDRLFRASRLYRAKWDEQRRDTTYGAETINNVLSTRGRDSYYQSKARRREGFTILSKNAFLERPEPDWLVENFLIEQGFAVLFGEPGSGKSYVALDMACHIALGMHWAALPVTSGPVLYVTAEGNAKFGKRIRAWEQEHKRDTEGALYVLPDAPQMMNGEEVGSLQAAIKELGVTPHLIVLDTLGRTFVGGEENSAKDMGQYVAGCDAIREGTGATVLVLHHGNKQDGKLRGSTALAGAADTVLKAELAGETITLTCDKQKDAERCAPMHFAAKAVTVAENETALVLTRTSEPGCADAATQAQPTGHTGRVLSTLTGLSVNGEEVRQSDWRRACNGEGITKSTFERARDRLVTQGRVIRREGNANSVFYRPAEPTRFEGMTSMNGREDVAV